MGWAGIEVNIGSWKKYTSSSDPIFNLDFI
jgi:hypothetical protein